MAELESALRPQEPTGLDYLPAARARRALPHQRPALAPRVEPRPADEARFLQALFEGIAGIEKLGYDRLAELGGPPLRSVRSVGGGARNIAWTAIRGRALAFRCCRLSMPMPRAVRLGSPGEDLGVAEPRPIAGLRQVAAEFARCSSTSSA